MGAHHCAMENKHPVCGHNRNTKLHIPFKYPCVHIQHEQTVIILKGSGVTLVLLPHSHWLQTRTGRVSWHVKWNVSYINGKHFTCPSEKQIIDSVWKGEMKNQIRRWLDEASVFHFEKQVIHISSLPAEPRSSDHEGLHSTEKAGDSVDMQLGHFMLMIWRYQHT